MSFIRHIPRGLKIAGVALQVSLAPVAVAVIASLIAVAASCAVHEGGATPCMIAGVEAGAALNAMFTAGWLGFQVLLISSLFTLAEIGIAVFDFMNARER